MFMKAPILFTISRFSFPISSNESDAGVPNVVTIPSSITPDPFPDWPILAMGLSVTAISFSASFSSSIVSCISGCVSITLWSADLLTSSGKCVGIVSFKLVRIWENFSTSLARVVTSRVRLAK